MTANSERTAKAVLPRWSWFLVPLVAVIGLGVLIIGWGMGVDEVKRILPTKPTMVPSTATLFAVMSLALLYYGRNPDRTAVLRASAIFCIVIALLNVAVYQLGISNGIDDLLWPGLGDFSRERMAYSTSLCFTLLGISLLALPGDGRGKTIFVAAATCGWLFALVTLVGYLFEAKTLHSILLFTNMALSTSVLFVILFTAVLFSRPHRGWIRVLAGSGPGSATARRMMPLVVGVPLLLCFLVLLGGRAGLYDMEFQMSVLAILIIILLGARVLKNAAIENRAQQELVDRVQRLTDDNEILMQELHHRVKNSLQQINALIMMESRSLPESQKAALASLSSRVNALASVHDLLQSTGSSSTLHISPFLQNLCTGIVNVSGANERKIEIHVEAEDRPVKVDVAVLIGFLVNELVTNALKHAFDEGDTGSIRVSLETVEENHLRLMVQDNGRGLAENYASAEARGTGSRIIDGLIRQLGGSMEITSNEGTTVEVIIPLMTPEMAAAANA